MNSGVRINPTGLYALAGHLFDQGWIDFDTLDAICKRCDEGAEIGSENFTWILSVLREAATKSFEASKPSLRAKVQELRRPIEDGDDFERPRGPHYEDNQKVIKFQAGGPH